MDPLADALSAIKNAERVGKKEVIIKVGSKLIENVLKVMQQYGYVGQFERIQYSDRAMSFMIRVELLGRINNCNAIKPRYSVRVAEFEKYEERYLPARDIGILIVSTSQGVMSHHEAKKRGIGGKLVAFVY